MEKFTLEKLKTYNIQKLREIHRKLGGTPSTKNADVLADEIIKIQNGEIKLQRSTRGRKPKDHAEIPKENPTPLRYPEDTPYPTECEFKEFGFSDIKPQKYEAYSDTCEGVFEPHTDGYGFLRTHNYECSSNSDIFVTRNIVKQYSLRRGDFVKGCAEEVREQASKALKEVYQINGKDARTYQRYGNFDDFIAEYPDEKLIMERVNDGELSLRCIDLLCPIGKGQRGLIVAPPKAGKTTLLKQIAKSIEKNYEDVHLIVLLIDERPEEVTDMTRSVKGEVVYSTFDETAEHHIKTAELVLWRAKRLVETGRNVVILLDSLTRLARAYNSYLPSSGKTLSGGLDPMAMQGPKKFFGSARKAHNVGSLTILATALVETGSKMDDVIYEEFKGTGNMEIFLTRELSERRIFPALDLLKSGTRKDELLLSKEEYDCSMKVRKILGENNGVEGLLDMLSKTQSNSEFVEKIDGWLKFYK